MTNMGYCKYFKLADDVILHLNTVVTNIEDQFISSRYTGFIAVSAATVYELSIKDIFCEFGTRKHRVLGNFTEKYFRRINGRIKTDHIYNYIRNFGEKYVNKFKKKSLVIEDVSLRSNKVSVLSSYNNIIEWRNSFAHEGQMPATVTYEEVVKAYEAGKEVLRCLSETMNR